MGSDTEQSHGPGATATESHHMTRVRAQVVSARLAASALRQGASLSASVSSTKSGLESHLVTSVNTLQLSNANETDRGHPA